MHGCRSSHGRHIAAIGKSVNVRPLGFALPTRELEQRAQVVDVRVDAAVGDEPEQVDAPAALECGDESGVLEERSVLDRLVHAHQVLVQPPARADRQVADLGVAHLAGRQSGRLTRRVECRVRERPPEAVEDRRVCLRHRVPGAGWRTAPAVEHDQRG